MGVRFETTTGRVALLDREARVATSESRVAAYRKNLDAISADLARRQDFIEQMVESQVGTLLTDVKADETVSDSRGEAGRARSHRVRAGVARSAAETTARSAGNPTLSATTDAPGPGAAVVAKRAG